MPDGTKGKMEMIDFTAIIHIEKSNETGNMVFLTSPLERIPLRMNGVGIP